MTRLMPDKSQLKAARIAGIMFLLAFIVPTLNWIFLLSRLIEPENPLITGYNILANQLIFRVGITIELLMSGALIVLGLALYIILKPVNKNVALLALLWKVVEAALAAAIVLISFSALHILDGQTVVTAFSAEQLRIPAGIILNAHTALYSIPMVFLGLDMVIFTYLFFISKYIPKVLAVFGILSFTLIFIHVIMFMVTPELATLPVNQIIFWAPSGLFEIIIGIWLLAKGLRVEPGMTKQR